MHWFLIRRKAETHCTRQLRSSCGAWKTDKMTQNESDQESQVGKAWQHTMLRNQRNAPSSVRALRLVELYERDGW